MQEVNDGLIHFHVNGASAVYSLFYCIETYESELEHAALHVVH